MRRWIGMLLTAATALSLSACGKPEQVSILESAQETQEYTLPEVPEGAITDESGSFVYDGPLQQGGDDENGYIQVPLGYLNFQEEGVEGLTQYCDTSGTNIVTLDFYENINYQDAANNLRAYMESQTNIEGLTGATVTINGYNALQLYCHFTDANLFLVTWLIEDPANPMDTYYLAIEFSNEKSSIMACSSTFQTKEDYHAAQRGAVQE